MCEAIFDCANQLYGLRFVPRPDIEVYHPDVKTYEVREVVDGTERIVAIFLHGKYVCTLTIPQQGITCLHAYILN
jgi:peptidyl-dipeptidase Dcp